MSQSKFNLIIQELVNLLKSNNLQFSGKGALVLKYENTSCRIEDASNLGLQGRIMFFVLLEDKNIDPLFVLGLNGDCYVTSDGYIGIVNNNYHYIRTIDLPNHPRILLREIKNTINFAMGLIGKLSKN